MTTAIDLSGRGKHRPWFVATLGGMASYIDGATIVTTAVSLVLFQAQLHFSAFMLGLLSAALTFSFATGAIVGGRLGDLLGRRKVYSVDLVVYAVGALTVILSPNEGVLLAGIIVTGLAMGADVPTSLALVAEEAPKGRQGGAVAFSQTLWLVGVGIVQLISFWTGSMGGLGARLLWVHLLVVAIIVWIARRGIVESAVWEESRAKRHTTGAHRLSAVFKKPYGLALLATGVFFIATGVMPNTIGQFGPYLVTTLGHSTISVFSIIGEVTLVLGLVVAVLFQRFVDGPRSQRAFFVIGILAVIAGPIVAIIGHFAIWSLVVLWIANTIGGTWAGEGMYKVWSQSIFPTEMRSSAQGFTYGIGRYAMAGVGLVTPLLMNEVPVAAMLMLSAFGAVGAVVGLVWIPRLPRHGRTDVDESAAGVPSAALPGTGVLAGDSAI